MAKTPEMPRGWILTWIQALQIAGLDGDTVSFRHWQFDCGKTGHAYSNHQGVLRGMSKFLREGPA